MGIKGQNASKKDSCSKALFQQSSWCRCCSECLSVQGNQGQNSTVEYEKALTHAQNYISQISHGSKFDHTLPKSLRQRIRELILAQAATKEIVDQLKTSKEYVYKERGKLKREGLLVTHQSLSTSNGQGEITVVKDQPRLMEYVDHDGSGTIHCVNDYDIPPS